VRRILNECDAKARAILNSHQEIVHRVAASLLERETLDREELDALVEGRTLAARPERREPPAREGSGKAEEAAAAVPLAPKPQPA